jgi:hypothetical protein
MRRTALLIGLLAAAAAAAPSAAPAYPPITCGRMTVSARTLIVRTHGPTCGFALRWTRSFIAHHSAPKGYRCRAYGAAVPADCLNRVHTKRYFLATQQ